MSQAKKKYLDFLYKQYNKGAELSDDKVGLLKAAGYLDSGKVVVPKKDTRPVYTTSDWEHDMSPFKDEWRYRKMNPVESSDWRPGSVLKHEKAFTDWINSITYGYFPNRIFYEPFDKYKAQAWQWLQDDDNITQYQTPESRRDYVHREYRRCSENTLYFANKYGELKEGDIASGRIKFKAREHQAIILYLFDCGYNVIGGKGRQIGFTSIMGLATLKRLLFQANFYVKFITEDADTGEEIFTDKIKYPFSSLSKWMQPGVRSDSNRRFWLSNKKKKGEQGFPNSRVDVIAPKSTAINGGSPQLALIDEIGNIPILGSMLNEARPTMFWNNPITGAYELKRQVFMWGTGGKMDKGGGAYEKEWYRIMGLWESGEHEQSGFIPLFFSWHCRLSKEDYLKEKAWYYGARAQEKDIDLETSKTQFAQHYPSSFKDMFLTTSSTLVSRDIIEDGLERCMTLSPMFKPVYGYFEPVYDETRPMPIESDTPYKIVGANFVAVDDDDMRKATTIMFQKPELAWRWRYWQGTDPIATETGHSKMSSVIWDDYYKTVSCIMNFRKQHDHKYVFLQTLLMGIYYDTQANKTGVKELLEANIGTNYTDYKQSKGFFNSLIFNSELPTKVIGGVREVGIDNKGVRADAIIDYLTEVIRAYHDRVYIRVIFDQLLTFVQRVTGSGKETWGVFSKSMHYDDVLYALAYAYIARLCYPHVVPVQETVNPSKFRIRWELTRMDDGSVVRMPVKRPILEEVQYEVPDLFKRE